MQYVLSQEELNALVPVGELELERERAAALEVQLHEATIGFACPHKGGVCCGGCPWSELKRKAKGPVLCSLEQNFSQ